MSVDAQGKPEGAKSVSTADCVHFSILERDLSVLMGMSASASCVKRTGFWTRQARGST